MLTALGYYIALFFAAATQGGDTTSSGDDGPVQVVGDAIESVFQAISHVPTVIEVVAEATLYGIGLIALGLLAFTMWKRVRRISLVIRSFGDAAVPSKVGAGVAALVEERLVGALRRKEKVRDGYELDLVVTDVDLLTEDDDLAKALERLADVPQLQIVVGVLDLIERLLPSRGLAAAGQLLPAGAQGAGISLALYEGNRLTARSALWEKEVNTWLPGEEDEGTGMGDDPSPYYRLAYPAAWWLQHEAARVLDSNASQITTSGRSFALVGLGLSRERLGKPREAEEAYSRALRHDPDNVAALVNLAQLLARNRYSYAPAALLLMHASDVLFQRHASAKR